MQYLLANSKILVISDTDSFEKPMFKIIKLEEIWATTKYY